MTRNALRALLAVCLLSACSGKKNDTDELGDGGSRDGAASDGATGAGANGDGSVRGDGATGSGMDASSDAGTGTVGGGGDGSASVTADAGPFVVNDAGQVLCGNAPCACSDGRDQDMDGLIDLADPECVSAWDNDEATFATGISGDNRDDACQDCFFDGNSGSGNDGCRTPSSCLTTGLPTSGQGSCNSCEATTQCKNFCQKYTPNGCDCFGCCGVKLANGTVSNVLLAAGCNIDGSNVTGCTQCVPSTTCVNTCGRCELCPGKTLADLPADCATTSTPGTDGGAGTGNTDGGTGTGTTDGGTGTPVITPSCDNGEARCGAGLPACATGSSCTFSCCVLTPLILF